MQHAGHSRWQARQWPWLVLLACLLWTGAVSAAPSESATYRDAEKAFTDGFYDRADREFGDFIGRFPKTSRQLEAILYQARARLQLKQYDAGITLLRENIGRAEKLSDRYQYWLAEGLFQKGDYRESAAQFEGYLKQYPESNRRLEAALRQATALFKLGDPGQVITVLKDPHGIFQASLKNSKDAERVVEGYLLLGEALLASSRFNEVSQATDALSKLTLSSEALWRRQYLISRTQLAAGQLDEARKSVDALLTAVPGESKEYLAESQALKAVILERQNQPEAAIEAYQLNLAEGMPADRRRQAMLKVIDLSLAVAKPADTIRRLEQFIEKNPRDPSSDLARMTVGELRLKEYYALVDAARTNAAADTVVARTNALAQALGQFDRLLTESPEGPQAGKAYLNRGWCRWEMGQVAESLVDFRTATVRLPASEDQAIAVFKWADAQFQTGDYAGAVTNYQRVVAEFSGFPRVKSTLFDQALYQTVHAAVAAGQLESGEKALRQILEWYPDSYFSDRSLLVLGQSLVRHRRAEDARKLFEDFVSRFPQSTLAPQARLALARTQMQQRDWVAAIKTYEDWLAKFPNDAARPRAEFDLAWLNYSAGNETNAFNLFTNFVVVFPTNTLAPQAQNWIADHFNRQGDYPQAEQNYVKLFLNTNWPVSDLTYQARMMAGRMAVARQGFGEARVYFTNLINDTTCPANVKAEALFAHGDTFLEDTKDVESGGTVNRYQIAINAFGEIPRLFPSNTLVPAAYGKIAGCQLQLAAQDPTRYDQAVESFQRAFDAPNATLAVRCLAKIGLGQTWEKRAKTRPPAEQAAMLKTARDHYLDVIYFEKLTTGNEVPDPYYLKEAGRAAGQLLEEQQQFATAINLYTRLGQLLPSLRPLMDKRIKACTEQLDTVKVSQQN